MKYVRLPFFIGSVLHTSYAFATGWGAGGGMLPTDDINPWFLDNVTVATYCIDIDETNFGESLDVSRQAIRETLKFWADDFKAVNPIKEENVNISIATQKFKEIPCSESVDIRFQLGVLYSEQTKYVPVPQETAAMTIRTNYDSESLRGKGFVYISPERGPLALTSVSGFGTPIVANRWQVQNSQLLKLTLAHELGHVFGLTHNLNRWLMKADAVANILAGGAVGLFPVQRKLSFRTTTFRGLLNPVLWRDLTTSDEKHDEMRVSPLSGSTDLAVVFRDGAIESRVATIKPIDIGEYGTLLTVPRLLITQKQRVYPLKVPASGRLIVNSIDESQHISARFISHSPTLRSFNTWIEIKHDGSMNFTMPDQHGAIRRNHIELSDD